MALRRGNAASTVARRAEIMQAAFTVFANSGFSGSSLKAVATRVGMTEAGLLHHYPSKIELLNAVLAYRDEVSVEVVDGEGLTGLHLMARWVQLIHHNSKNREKVKFFCKMSAEATASGHPAHDYFKNRYKNVVNYWQEAFAFAQSEGKLAQYATPQSAARAITADSDGMQIQWLLDPNVNMVEACLYIFESQLTPEAFQELLTLIDLDGTEN